MFRILEKASSTGLVTAVFCEIFSAADAVRALGHSGFEEQDIELIGVLSGHTPDLFWFLVGMGIPADQAEYYNARFEEGAILVMVRTLPVHRKQIARRVLKRFGGIFAGG